MKVVCMLQATVVLSRFVVWNKEPNDFYYVHEDFTKTSHVLSDIFNVIEGLLSILIHYFMFLL